MVGFNAEFFAVTYGAIVTSLLEELRDPAVVTKELDKMGFNIGQRCVDEYLANSSAVCTKFHHTAAGVLGGLKMFLGCASGTISGCEPECSTYTIFIESNPLEKYVKFPAQLDRLVYSQVVCGAIRGALSLIGYNVIVELIPAQNVAVHPLHLRIELQNEITENFAC